METIIKAIDKGVRGGVYTLEETAIILKELEVIGRVMQEANKPPADEQPSKKEKAK